MRHTPETHFLFLRHLHLVRGACVLADLLTLIIVTRHAYLSNLVPNHFPSLPMLHLVSFSVLLEVRSLHCWRFVCGTVKGRSRYG